jgi:hypothetical protein
MSKWVKKEEPKVGLRRPERGPIPVTRSLVDLNSDVDVLQRRIGDQQDSAATIEDLASVGIVQQATDGSIIATPKNVGGPQNLYNFLKGFN